MKRIYLDHAAATPVDERVARTVASVSKKYSANPSALHREGRAARVVLEKARTVIAGFLSAHADEVVFTSGATEANNLALMGIVRAAQARGIKRPHVVISAIEHPSVLETARVLASEVRVDIVPVDGRGIIDTRKIRKILTPETVLVSVMYANNEIGVIEPIHEIAKEVRHARKMFKSVYPYFHTDAAQATNYLDMNVLHLGVDMMTFSSGKTYGPHGIGALFVKRGVNLLPLVYGGDHERGRRPGTESTALAAGFAEALILAEKIKAKETARIQKLRDLLAQKVLKDISGSSVNGDLAYTLPNMLSISFDGCDSEALVLYLDAAGFAVSGKSACKTSSTEPSHVMMALGKVGGSERGVIRFSLGRNTMREDITSVAKELARIVPLLRVAREKSDRV